MDIVPLTSNSIKKLREQRSEIVKNMTQNQSGTLLVLGGAFGGIKRQHHAVSYAVISVFFQLWDRYVFNSWSYTFDADGLIFYVQMDDDASAIKNTLIHYEDYHPLGFAIQSYVSTADKQEITREDLGVKKRLDFYTGRPVLEILDNPIDDPEYFQAFVSAIEKHIIGSEKQYVLGNMSLYGYVAAFTKEYACGVFGPNHRGMDPQMNFEKFIYVLRVYYKEVSKMTRTNLNNEKSMVYFQKNIEKAMQQELLTQKSFQYSVYMTTTILYAFLNSSGYKDILIQIKNLHKNLKNSLPKDSLDRYKIFDTGFKDGFTHYIPFYQKNKSVEGAFMNILSRYDDASIITDSGKQNLMKVQFLAKNLKLKEDKWIELHRFCISTGIYPYDSTIVLANTMILDLIQRNYLKIKIALEG